MVTRGRGLGRRSSDVQKTQTPVGRSRKVDTNIELKQKHDAGVVETVMLESNGFISSQSRFGHLESSQNAHRTPAVLYVFDQTRTRPDREQFVLRPISVPERQILRHDVRHRRQAHTVRTPCGRVQILVHVEGQGTSTHAESATFTVIQGVPRILTRVV